MRFDPPVTIQINLEALTPATRLAVESAQPGFVRIQEAVGQTSASVMTSDGRYVRIHGRAPETEADRLVDRVFPAGLPEVVIVIGPGLGHTLEAIERRAAGTKIIAIEPFPALARAMLERHDWREWIASDRLTLLLGPDYLGVADAARLLGEQTVATIVHPVLAHEFPAEIARARDIADRIVKGAGQNAGARKLFAGRYLLNTLRNTAAIVTEGDVSSLCGLFQAMPAIVVAAGPSLDARLEQIRALQDRALIVAVDTTLRPLLAAGVRPHLVVAVDPGELNATHLLGIADTAGLWLVSEGSIDSRVFTEFVGRIFTFRVSNHHPWPWLRAQGSDRGTLRAWGSVLTTAFDLACVAGCDPIVFVGADLAYTDGLDHCRATVFDSHPQILTTVADRAQAFAEWRRYTAGQGTCTEIDVRGQKVLSTPSFVQFRDWLVARATAVSDRRVWNATGNGILYGRGIVQVELESLALAPLPREVELRERIATAWCQSEGGRSRAWAHMKEAYASQADRVLPMQAWLQFAGENTSPERIATVVDHALREVPRISGVALVADKAAPQPLDTIVTWTATSTGGEAPHQYKWLVHDGAGWTAVTEWSADATFTWTPGRSLSWKIRVLVRSADDKFDEGEAAGEAEFATTGVSQVRLSTDTTAPHESGPITWTATATGGRSPYRYKWVICNGTSWADATDWLTDNRLTWTPPTPSPEWLVGVWVRSDGSTIDSPEGAAAAAVPFFMTDHAKVSLSSDKGSPHLIGRTVTFTASADGGVAPYQYKWCNFRGTALTALTDWQSSHEFIWNPTTNDAGLIITVWVRSADSTTDTCEASAGIQFTIR